MKRYVTPGTLKAFISILMFLAAVTGHKKLASVLSNPEVVEGIFEAAGIWFGISAGLSEGIKKHDDFDYTGWKWDSINGWTREDDSGQG